MSENNFKNTLLKVQNVVNDIPLDGILTTAEMVAGFMPVPYLDKVIKLLRILIRWRPVANGVMNIGTQALTRYSNDKESPSAPPLDEEAQYAKEIEDVQTMLNEMVEIAIEDGDITPEEEELLVDIAREAGINEKAFIAKLKMECLHKK